MSEITKRILLWLLRGYKWALSPLFPPSCRFVPTCSEYAIEAIERHGVMRGSALATWRLLRCQPFGRKGFDPVPLERSCVPPDSRGRLSPHGSMH